MKPIIPGRGASRRAFLELAGLGAAAVAAGPLLAGCSDKPAGSGSTQSLEGAAGVLPTHKDLTLAVKPDVIGTKPVPDGFTKYPATLVDAITDKPGTSGKEISAMTPVWGPAPPGVGKSAYLDAVNAELGSPINFTIQDGNTYADKLNAMFGARDVPELLCVPGWEIDKIPRFSDAIKVLFTDLTDYLKGDAAAAYPMLAAFPAGSWRNAVWNQRLFAVPNPTDTPFPYALFTRKDLLDARGLTIPKSLDELLAMGKQVTDPKKKVWAFGDIFFMVQMYHKVSGAKGGWSLGADKAPLFKYETPEYKQALEVMAKVYKDGLVHPDLVSSAGGDQDKLFGQSGSILFAQAGFGYWQNAQAQNQKINKQENIQPVPVFAAGGGDPQVWAGSDPISYTFIKAGLPKERVEELLRVINWCSAPLGTQEAQLRDFGVAGKHHTATADGPVKTDLAFKEIANQYFFVSGRNPSVGPFPETPRYVPEALGYANEMIKFAQKDPWEGLKLEMPARFAAYRVQAEEKFTDVLRGRRPITDVDALVKEWKANGGDEARALMAKALSEAGR